MTSSSVVWKTCWNCSFVWMSSSEDPCPNCHKFDNQTLNIDREVRKANREKVKKPSMFL
jgi:hypothetical protein